MAIEAGRVLSQRYRLIRPVGQGSQASVWVAEHLALTTHVAVKLIDPELAKKESARERFRREATAAAQLRSAHVVQILDHGIDDDQPFIVMELLDGEDLFERLAHRTRLSLRETSKIVTQVARALSRAHAAGIVHRDLKPENVFLCPNEDDEVVKVLDFGVAKVKDAAKVTMQKTGVGTLIGTPHYMSPEQVKGIGEVDYRADLWALGVIAFQCVTGELPYDSEGVGDLLIKITIGESPIPSNVYAAVHPNFDAWFVRACARDPAKRFQSAREMALALAGVVGVIDGIAPRAPTVRPPAALPGLAGIVAPRAPRAMTEALDASDWEEVDAFDDGQGAARPQPAAEAPEPRSAPPVTMGGTPMPPRRTTPAAATPPPPPPATRAPADSHESHDIVDFDETIPAHDLARGSIPLPLMARSTEPRSGKSALSPLSEPPRSPAQSARSGGPPASAAAPVSAPARDSGRSPSPDSRTSGQTGPPAAPPSRPQALLAPVVIPGPRSGISPPPSPDAVPASIPRPPPSSRNLPPSPPSASTGRPSAVPVVAPLRNGPLLTIPPPDEFDGSSRRRRLVRFMVAGLVLFAVGITWSVLRSQLDASPGVPAPPPTTATTEAPPPPPPVTATSTATAVDPGKVTHPTKPTPSVIHHAPVRPRPPKPTEGTIVVPDPDEDSVPAAP